MTFTRHENIKPEIQKKYLILIIYTGSSSKIQNICRQDIFEIDTLNFIKTNLFLLWLDVLVLTAYYFFFLKFENMDIFKGFIYFGTIKNSLKGLETVWGSSLPKIKSEKNLKPAIRNWRTKVFLVVLLKKAPILIHVVLAFGIPWKRICWLEMVTVLSLLQCHKS